MIHKSKEQLNCLFRRAVEGDQRALVELYESTKKVYAKLVYARARNVQEVEDLESDARLLFFKRWSRFKPEEGQSFTTFVFTITRNEFYSQYRRLQAKKRIDPDDLIGYEEAAEHFLAEFLDDDSIFYDLLKRRFMNSLPRESLMARVARLKIFSSRMSNRTMAQLLSVRAGKISVVLADLRVQLLDFIEQERVLEYGEYKVFVR